MEPLEQVTNNSSFFNLKGKVIDCKIVNIYDGDTMEIAFYFNNVLFKRRIRLYQCNAPELTPSKKLAKRDIEISNAINSRNLAIHLLTGIDMDIVNANATDRRKKSKNWIAAVLGKQQRVFRVDFHGIDKYGRDLCTVYINDTEDLASVLIEKKCAIKYDGGYRDPTKTTL